MATSSSVTDFIHFAVDRRGRVLTVGDRVIGPDGKTYGTIQSIPSTGALSVYTDKGYDESWDSLNALKVRG